MRKLTVFLVFMNLLLLGGGQYLNANTLTNGDHHNIHKHRVKFTNQDKGNSVIEDSDIDLEDDLLGNDDHNANFSNKFLAVNYSILDSWYLTFSGQSSVDDYNRFKIFEPAYGYSNPIYITLRVLRI